MGGDLFFICPCISDTPIKSSKIFSANLLGELEACNYPGLQALTGCRFVGSGTPESWVVGQLPHMGIHPVHADEGAAAASR